MPNNGFSSIQGGLLIATKNLNNGVAYDAETQTAKVGPGLTWSETQNGLAGTGRTVVGGRLGGVGVGGYILGGMISCKHFVISNLQLTIERWIEFFEFSIRLGGK